MSDNHTVEKYIESYPFLQYINDNNGQYKTRLKKQGYKDPNEFVYDWRKWWLSS
mgnify:CR=1 FL=1